MNLLINHLSLLRLAGLLACCWIAPPLLFHYFGPVSGMLAAAAAMALWYTQYRLPIWQHWQAASFWFVASGYGVIIITLLACLGRLPKGH